MRKEEGATSERSNVSNELTAMWCTLPVGFPARFKLLLVKFEEWLPDELAAHIVNGSDELFLAHLFFQSTEGTLDTGTVRGIGADANGMSAGVIDFFNDGLVVLGLASKQCNGIGLGELAGNRGTTGRDQFIRPHAQVG